MVSRLFAEFLGSVVTVALLLSVSMWGRWQSRFVRHGVYFGKSIVKLRKEPFWRAIGGSAAEACVEICTSVINTLA